jgi:flagellar basal body rod protein FlgG
VQGEFGGLTRYAEGAESWLQRLDEIAMNLVRVGDPLRGNPPQQWYSKQESSLGGLNKVGAKEVGFDGRDEFYDGIFRIKAFTGSGGFVHQTVSDPRKFQLLIKEGEFFGMKLPSGEIAYTVNGSFSLNDLGEIADSRGNVVVMKSPDEGDSVVGVPGGARFIEISRSGEVSAEIEEGRREVIGRIPTFTFDKPERLEPIPGEASLLRETELSGSPTEGAPGTDGRGTPGVLREFVRSLRPSLTLYSNITSGDMVPWAKAAEPNSDPPSPGGPADQSFAIGLAGMRATTSREWSEWVSRVSADMSGWRAEEAAFTSVDTSLREQREQISGVDLDEEATNLLRFQQIYQANSAVIQAAMRMFDVMLSQATR